MRRIAMWLAAALLCVLTMLTGGEMPHSPADPTRPGAFRALLVGCDHFVTQTDTWPAAERNVQMLGDALSRDVRGCAALLCRANAVSSVEELKSAAAEAFASAREGDVSLLYIGTHGEYAPGEGGAALLLSDGQNEEKLTAPALQSMLDAVPGLKIVILDACNSGAFIGKGLSDGAEKGSFAGPDYKVLCSAGGSEASWYFQGAEDAATAGASYFATVLTDGLAGGADGNADGLVTLDEIYDYLLENYAASTPQMYPQRDGDTVLYACGEGTDTQKTVTGLTFDDTLLTAGQSRISFSFTVRKEAELYYQVVYHENGVWQFAQAQHFLDAETEAGTVLPGRKARTILLDTPQEDAFGYVMLQLITREEGRPVFQGARLLCVQPAEGEVALSAAADEAFDPAAGQEARILIRHDVPCALTVSILNAQRRAVRFLAYGAPTRPQQLTPNASSFYWDGRTQQGDMAPPGLYTVQARVTLGDRVFAAESAPVRLLGPAEADDAREPAADDF